MADGRLEPLSRTEWNDIARSTMHGAPPTQTLFRMYTTLDHLFTELDEATRLLIKAFCKPPHTELGVDIKKFLERQGVID